MYLFLSGNNLSPNGIVEDENNELKAILYEVKNTFNEQHTYIFPVQKNAENAKRKQHRRNSQIMI